MIFRMALEGCNTRQIAKALFQKGVAMPGEYKAAKVKHYHDISAAGHLAALHHPSDFERRAHTALCAEITRKQEKLRVFPDTQIDIKWKMKDSALMFKRLQSAYAFPVCRYPYHESQRPL